jgi:hypothetical protein
MKQSSPESTYLFVCERDIKVMLHKNLERHSHMWQFSGITSYIICCKQVINKKVQTITKYFCKSPAETKTSSSWTAEGRAPSPRGLVELEDETNKQKKSFQTRIRSSNKILKVKNKIKIKHKIQFSWAKTFPQIWQTATSS